jgi:Ca2+-binding EF-hand superfamily protein
MISSRLARLALGAAIVVLMTPAAMADDRAAPGQGRAMYLDRFFDKLDGDGDGAVSRAEAEQAGENIFAMLDTDGDGVVSEQEFLQPRRSADPGAGWAERWREHRARRFAAMDRDGDGVITPEEREDFGDRRFAMADANGDGLVTRAEMRALLRKRGRS